MKKMVSILLVLVLCLSAASALADVIVPSKTPVDDYEVIVIPSPAKTEVKVTLDPNDPNAVALLEKMIAVQKDGGSVDDFFGAVILPDGTASSVSALFGTDAVTVNELVGIKVEGTVDGKITLILDVPSVYQPGDKVYVLIGILVGEPGDVNAVTWYAFEATVTEKNQVAIELTPELFKAMQDKESVIAIVSVTK
jgi:hypothetical protein